MPDNEIIKKERCEMNHVTSRMIEKASKEVTPFNKSKSITIVIKNSEMKNNGK